MPIVFAGYYCLFGEPNPQPCPAGTYNNETGRDDVTDCSPCSVGQYCEGTGNSVPDGGYYLSRLVGKPTMWFLTRSDTNRPVQAQKQARSLKFWS